MKLVNKILTGVYAVALVSLGILLANEAKAETKYSLIMHTTSVHGKTSDNYKFNSTNLGYVISQQLNVS
jgi:hypothetical protein